MKLSLLAALAQLDPQNTNHWTGEGLPRLDTVKFLTGDSSVTREAITAAAPSLTRATPLQAAQAGGGEGSTGEAKETQPAPAQAAPLDALLGDGNGGEQTVDDGAGDNADTQVGPSAEVQQEADPIADAQRALDAALAAKAEADRAVAAASAALDRAIEAREAARAEPNADNGIAAYLASQQRLLQERAARIQALKGVDLKSILPTRAKIDEALQRRNSRGMQRPRTF